MEMLSELTGLQGVASQVLFVILTFIATAASFIAIFLAVFLVCLPPRRVPPVYIERQKPNREFDARKGMTRSKYDSRYD